MKVVSYLVLSLCVFCFLCGIIKCSFLNHETPDSSLTEENTNTLCSVPIAEDIPDDKLFGEAAVIYFSKDFTSISYCVNGTKIDIAPGDPRLIRMFNLMGMSFDDHSIGYTQGTLDKEAYDSVYKEEKVRVECEFVADDTGDPAKYVFIDNKMLFICYQDEFHIYQYQGIPKAIEYYPYFLHFPYSILDYCGF